MNRENYNKLFKEFAKAYRFAFSEYNRSFKIGSYIFSLSHGVKFCLQQIVKDRRFSDGTRAKTLIFTDNYQEMRTYLESHKPE